MPSSFTWLDYSDQDRQQTMEIIELFRKSDTRDELGIGRVRDTFSNLLFPGTSTIQTRAKYFLFVPWVYLKLERHKVSSNKIEKRARQEEVKLIYTLLELEDNDGTIGKMSKDQLVRMPSGIYWQGLGEWGIRLFPGSRRQYYRSLDHYYRTRSLQQKDQDGNLISGGLRPNWHPGIPEPPEEFPSEATLDLTKKEAAYLQERLLTHVGESLLCYLVDHRYDIPETSFPWQVPGLEPLPEPLNTYMFHARNFSELIWGAPLLYNLMLAELEDQENFVDRYQARLQEWRQQIQQREADFTTWDREAFWNIVEGKYGRMPFPTRRFINHWWDVALNSPDEVHQSSQARELIRQRERALKKGQARLFSQRAREMWSGSAGTTQLDYRWGSGARQIIVDIIQGLQG